jgi:hypothetical protein
MITFLRGHVSAPSIEFVKEKIFRDLKMFNYTELQIENYEHNVFSYSVCIFGFSGD